MTTQENLTLIRPDDEALCVRGQLQARYVPVSFVAKSMSVSPRRVRFLLVTERLSGRRLDNGYWEVLYPFNLVVGTRGPRLSVFQPRSEIEREKYKRKLPLQWIHESSEQFQERLKAFKVQKKAERKTE